MGRYMDRVVALSTESERVRLTLMEAMNMLKPPYALFGPAIALKVLRGALIGREKDETAAPEQSAPEAA